MHTDPVNICIIAHYMVKRLQHQQNHTAPVCAVACLIRKRHKANTRTVRYLFHQLPQPAILLCQHNRICIFALIFLCQLQKTGSLWVFLFHAIDFHRNILSRHMFTLLPMSKRIFAVALRPDTTPLPAVLHSIRRSIM